VVEVLGGGVGDELAGLFEACGGLCLRIGHVTVDHLVVVDLGFVLPVIKRVTSHDHLRLFNSSAVNAPAF
jgi:hypothetical protein